MIVMKFSNSLSFKFVPAIASSCLSELSYSSLQIYSAKFTIIYFMVVKELKDDDPNAYKLILNFTQFIKNNLITF